MLKSKSAKQKGNDIRKIPGLSRRNEEHSKWHTDEYVIKDLHSQFS